MFEKCFVVSVVLIESCVICVVCEGSCVVCEGWLGVVWCVRVGWELCGV